MNIVNLNGVLTLACMHLYVFTAEVKLQFWTIVLVGRIRSFPNTFWEKYPMGVKIKTSDSVQCENNFTESI